jgi:hypothetical protein
LNQPLIQFPLCLESPVSNIYSNTSFSLVGDEDNGTNIGIDDFLWDTHAMEVMLLNSFQPDELGDDAHIIDIFSKSMKSTSTTPLFGHESRYTQKGKTLLLYNLK